MTLDTSGSPPPRLPAASAMLTHTQHLARILQGVQDAALQGAAEGIPTPELDAMERALGALLARSREMATALSAREFWGFSAVHVGVPAAEAARNAA